MITGTQVLITQTQADSMASSLGTWFTSILNLLFDFRHAIIAIVFFWLVIRFFKRKRNNNSGGEIVSESRAVSGSGTKYGSIGGKAKSKGSVRNRFGFK